MENKQNPTGDYTTQYYLETHVCEKCGGRLGYNEWDGIRCPSHPNSGIVPKHVYKAIQRQILRRNCELLGRLEDDFEGFD